MNLPDVVHLPIGCKSENITSNLAGDSQTCSLKELVFPTETIRSQAKTHVRMVRVSSTSSLWLRAGVRAEIRNRNSLGCQLPAKRDEWLQACHREKEVTAEAEAKREHTQYYAAFRRSNLRPLRLSQRMGCSLSEGGPATSTCTGFWNNKERHATWIEGKGICTTVRKS